MTRTGGRQGRAGKRRGAADKAAAHKDGTMPPIAFVAAGVPRRGGEGQGEFGGPIVCVFVFYKKDQLTVFGVIVGGGQRTRDDLRHFVGWPAGRGESLLLPPFHSMKQDC